MDLRVWGLELFATFPASGGWGLGPHLSPRARAHVQWASLDNSEDDPGSHNFIQNVSRKPLPSLRKSPRSCFANKLKSRHHPGPTPLRENNAPQMVVHPQLQGRQGQATRPRPSSKGTWEPGSRGRGRSPEALMPGISGRTLRSWGLLFLTLTSPGSCGPSGTPPRRSASHTGDCSPHHMTFKAPGHGGTCMA